MSPRLSKIVPLALAAALVGGVTIPVFASTRGTQADTTVTIRTENGDFWGQVKSNRPMKCAEGRKVVVFKQVGSSPNPSADTRIASDTASQSGDRYEWSTGNTGRTSGRYYARVGHTDDCKADNSETVRVVRD